MLNIYPTLYRLGCASCGGVATLPFDIIQTRVLSNQSVVFRPEEAKFLIFMPLIFVFQNTIYNWSCFIANQSIRGLLSGLSAAPFYILLESKKLYIRLNILPKYKNLIFWMTIRQVSLYIILYNLYLLNIKYANIYAALTANLLCFPLKMIAMKTSYPSLNINLKSFRKTGLLEILKCSTGDGLTLFLIYNFKYSPFKN